MTDIFLGEPPADIKAWIIEHQGPTGHADTRFTLEGGTVETYDITGTLDQQWMVDNGYFDDENYEWKKTITQADIGNTVTIIGTNGFSGCRRLTSVTIPDSVTSILDTGFSYCISLASVTIPNNVTYIGFEAFSGCSGLTSVTIPDSVTSIGDSAFFYCDSITSVTIIANDGNAENVKQMLINAGVDPNVTWNM